MASLYVICFGEQAVKTLQENHWGLKCDKIILNPAANVNIWYARLGAFNELLTQGHDVFATDIDALWISDPFETINQYPGYDLVAQRGKHLKFVVCPKSNPGCGIPDEMTWGSDFCFGLIYYRSSHEMIAWVDETMENMRNSFPNHLSGDQMTFSDIFHRLTISGDAVYDRQADRFGDEYATAKMKYANSTLRLASVPQKEWLRDCIHTPEYNWTVSTASVIHCNTHDFSSFKKNDVIRAYGTWILHDDWYTISYKGDGNNSNDYGQYLQSIADFSITPHDFKDKVAKLNMLTSISCYALKAWDPAKNCIFVEKPWQNQQKHSHHSNHSHHWHHMAKAETHPKLP
jgi:hypothetical protein